MDSTRKIIEITQNEQNPIDNGNPLEKHINYFGGHKNGDISYTSIKKRNESLGDTRGAAALNAAVVITAAGIKINGCPFSTFKAKNAIGILNHAYSTGIFNLDGSINDERWRGLLAYTEKSDKGKAIITEENFYKFLEACRKQETRADPLWVGYNASNGEWSAFFDKFSNGTTKDNKRYVTVSRLQKFYHDSEKVGEKIEHQVLHRI